MCSRHNILKYPTVHGAERCSERRKIVIKLIAITKNTDIS